MKPFLTSFEMAKSQLSKVLAAAVHSRVDKHVRERHCRHMHARSASGAHGRGTASVGVKALPCAEDVYLNQNTLSAAAIGFVARS